MNLLNSVLSSSGSIAKGIGNGGLELAKGVGSGGLDLAKTLGNGSLELAKSIGWKRGLIGLAAIAAAAGGTIVLVRYLRSRGAAAEDTQELTAEEIQARRVPKHKKHKAFVAHH